MTPQVQSEILKTEDWGFEPCLQCLLVVPWRAGSNLYFDLRNIHTVTRLGAPCGQGLCVVSAVPYLQPLTKSLAHDSLSINVANWMKIYQRSLIPVPPRVGSDSNEIIGLTGLCKLWSHVPMSGLLISGDFPLLVFFKPNDVFWNWWW